MNDSNSSEENLSWSHAFRRAFGGILILAGNCIIGLVVIALGAFLIFGVAGGFPPESDKSGRFFWER